MNKLLQKAFLFLLSAGWFTAVGIAAEPIAVWKDFAGLTAETPLAPTSSATVNGVDGSLWRFNLAGGSVSDGALTTGTASAPNIAFGSTINVGYDNKVMTVLLKLQVPVTSVDGAPFVHLGNGTNGIGLASTDANKVCGSWQNTHWYKDTNTGTIDALAAAESEEIYLAVSPCSEGLSFAVVTYEMESLAWTVIASGLKSNSINATQITFGNYVNSTSGGLNYTLKGVAVLSGKATLDEMKGAIRTIEGIQIAEVTRELSGSESWSDADWTPSAPTADSNVTLTVASGSTLTMDAAASVVGLTIAGDASLTIATTDSNKLTASTTAINADTTVEAGAATLGAVTIDADNTLTVKETPTNVYTSLSNNGSLCLDGGDATTPLTIVNNNALGKILLADGAVVKMTATGGNKIYNIEGVANATVKPELRLHSGQGWGVTIPGSAFKNVKLVLPEKNNNEETGTHSFWLTPSTLANDASVDLEIKGGQGLTFENVNSVTAIFGSFVTNGAFTGTSIQTATGAISGSGNTTDITVTNSGEGSFTVARAYGSTLTINENGCVTVAEGGSLTSTVTNAGDLTYAVATTASNTITNNGTITADTATVDLTGATLSGSGTYAVKNGATLILPLAQTPGKTIEVAEDATLQVELTAVEQLSAQSVTITGTGTVQFVDAGGNVLAEDSSYTPAIPEYTYTLNGEGAGTWNAAPTAGAKITLDFGATEGQTVDLTAALGEITSVAQLIVTGTNGGTITKTENGSLTIGMFSPQTNVTVTGAFLKDCVTEHATITVPETKTLSISVPDGGTEWDCALKHSFDGTGIVKKIGAGSLSVEDAYTAFTCPNMVVDEGAFRVASGDTFASYTNAYAITVNDGAKFMLGYNAALTGNTTITLNDGATMECKNGNHSTVSTAAIVVNGNATIKGSLYSNGTTFSGGVSGNGTLTLEKIADNGNPLTFSGVISGGLQVIISEAQSVTFSGANTYTGGTVIAAEAQLINNNGSALGNGKVTGAGTLIVNIGKHPGNYDKFGFAEAGWQGTVEFTGGNFATSVDFAKWQNAKSAFKVASGATISAANSSSVTGTLMGGGTITNALTFASGATLDATTETLTATGAVNFGETLNVKVSGDIAGTQILKKTDANITEEVVVENVTVLVNGEEGYCLAQNAEGYVLREKVANPEVSATVDADGTTLSEALNGETLTANATLTIDFGETSGQSFTFDNTDDVSFAQIIVMGTNGGTIAKTGTGAVSATTTTIEEGCTVTVPASTATLGAVEVKENAKIVVADVATITSATGAGTIETSVYPTTGITNWSASSSIAGLTDSDAWMGTLKFNKGGEIAQDAFRLDLLGNANSTIEIAEGTTLKGYLGLSATSPSNTSWTTGVALVVNGTLNVNNGFSGVVTAFTGDLTGAGEIKVEKVNPTDIVQFSGDLTGFMGTITLNSSTRRILMGAGDDATAQQGKIVITKPVTIANGKTWTATSGVVVTSTGVISGAGTIGSTLTLNAGATIVATASEIVTVSGALTLQDTLTIQLAEALDNDETVTVLTANVEATTLPATVTVKVGNDVIDGTFVLGKSEGNTALTLTKVPVSNLTATVPAEGLSYSTVIGGAGELAATVNLTIDFGDGATAGTFTFDNDAAVSFNSITVTGTNGGTITKSGAGTVATATMMIEEGRAAIPAGTLTAQRVTIEQDATLVVADVTTVAAVEGAGTLETSVYPTTGTISNYAATLSIEGLTDDTWTGTLCFNANGTITQNGLRFDLLGNANSTIEIAEGTTVAGYFGLINSNGWTAEADFVLDGTLSATDGFTGKSYVFAGDLTGHGTLSLATKTMTETFYFSGDASAFGGTITLATGRSVVFGPSSVANVPGKIVLASSVKIGTTWTSGNGYAINLLAGATLDLNGQNLTVTELTSAGAITDTAETKGAITVNGGAVNVTGSCTVPVTVDLSTYYSPTTFVVPDGTTFNTTGTLIDYLTYDENTKTISAIALTTTLTDEMIWLPVGDSITEGEADMGHPERGDTNSRGGYRYQLWKLMEDLGQETRSVGFRTGHSGTTEDPATVDWAWNAGLYGGAIKRVNGNHGGQWYNVESALETAGYPDVITVLLGINDLSWSGEANGYAKIYEDWTAMVEKYATLRPHSKILVSTLLPVTPGNNSAERYGPFNDLMRADATAKTGAFKYNNVIFTDVCLNAFNNTFDATNFKGDGIHPNETGSIKVATAFHLGMKDVLAAIAADPLTIVHAHNAADGTLTVRLNKAIESVDGLTATITGMNFAGETVEVSLSGGSLDENNKRVITFTLEDDLVNGDYTVTVNGTVNGEALASTLTATGATVEILGTGAAQNVKPAFLEGFKHRKTYTLAGTNSNVADAHTVIDGADAEDEISDPVKVGYYMELQRAGQPAQFVWVSMNAFADAEANLGIPTAATGAYKTKVSNLNVFANRGNFTKEVTGGTGMIEFTPWSWTAADQEAGTTYPVEGQPGYYGWNDTLEMAAGTLKGCMQIARITDPTITSYNWQNPAAEMLFAYNNFNSDTLTDVGIGSFVTHRNDSGSSNPQILFDWTNFSSTTGYTTYQPDAYTVKKIELWVSDVAPVPETTAIIDVGEGDGQYTTWLAAKTGLNLADEMESLTINFTAADQTFTFDNAGEVSLATLSVQGEAGTLAKTGAGTVTVSEETQIATMLTVAGQIQLNGIAIEDGATLAISDYRVIGTPIDGAGTLSVSNATLTQALDAKLVTETWTGTVVLNAIQDSLLDVAKLVNAASNLTLDGEVEAYVYNCSMNQLTLNGSFRGINGTSNSELVQTATVAKLVGEGTLYGHATANGATAHVRLFFADVTDFAGSVALPDEKDCGTTILFGPGETTAGGKVVVSTQIAIASGKAWTAKNGFDITTNGTLDLNGNTLTASALTGSGCLVDNAEVKGSLAIDGTTDFAGVLEIGTLQVNANASFTLSGATDSTVSSLSGNGTLTLNNANSNKVAHLVLTGTSDYSGAICLDGNTELKLSGVEQESIKTGATLNVLGSLQLKGAVARLNTLDAGFSDALVKIASGATLIPGGASGRQNANVEMADGAVLDVRNQSLGVNGFKLASETAQIEVIAGEIGALLSASKGIDALAETNFLLSAESPILSESVTEEMLHFYVMPGYGQVALVQVEAELDGLSEADKQAIFWTVYTRGLPVREITNRDVPAIFVADYGSGYFMTTTSVTEDGVEKMDVAYAVNFGISEITAHKDAEDNILFNITATVEPYQTGAAIAFQQNVEVVLLKGNDVVATQTIDAAGVSEVCFENVPLLPTEAGTVTLTVRATSASE